jgi:hypothetical protein
MSDQYSVRLGPGIHKVSTIQDPIADSAFRIYTQKKENDALYYLTFVGVNSTTPSPNPVFTSSGLSFNPYRSIISYATSSLTIGNTSNPGITSFIGKVKIGGDEILSSTGQAVVGFGGSDVLFPNNVLVNNNLVVNGSFISNVPSLSVEGRLLDIGLLNGGVGVVSDTTWDLGLVFNYNESNTRKRTALIWEYSTKRFQFSNNFISTNTGDQYSSPQLTISEFAPIEVDSLWINNSCSSGPQVVIGCNNGELQLQNVSIDEGIY